MLKLTGERSHSDYISSYKKHGDKHQLQPYSRYNVMYLIP